MQRASPPEEVYMSDSPAAHSSGNGPGTKSNGITDANESAKDTSSAGTSGKDQERSSRRRLHMPHLHPLNRPEMAAPMRCGCVPCVRHRSRVVRVDLARESTKKGLHKGKMGRDKKGRPNQSKVEFERLFWFKRPRLMLRVFQYVCACLLHVKRFLQVAWNLTCRRRRCRAMQCATQPLRGAH